MVEGQSPLHIERYAAADIPTQYGMFRVVVYRDGATGEEHCAVVCGEVAGTEDALVRVHSECFTGEVLRSLKCDCREQLDLAMRRIAEAGRGVVVYLRQEGRGIGLGNKIRAYALQQEGLDTIDANERLGFEPDLRDYDVAHAILSDLGIRSIALMTNNPEKLAALSRGGIPVTRRVPLEIDPNGHNDSYLRTKRVRMGHWIGSGGSGSGGGGGTHLRALAPDESLDLK